MEKIIKTRQSGKTTELIKISEQTGIYILTADRNRAKIIFKMAREQNKNIPFPVTVGDYMKTGFKGSFIKHILIDDADAVLQQMFGNIQIVALTMTGKDNTCAF